MSNIMGGRISIKHPAMIRRLLAQQEIWWCRSKSNNFNKTNNHNSHSRTLSACYFSTSSTLLLSKLSPKTFTSPITTSSSGRLTYKWTLISNSSVFAITFCSSCLICWWVMRVLMRTRTRRGRICRMRWRRHYCNVCWGCCIERETAPMQFPSSNSPSASPNTTPWHNSNPPYSPAPPSTDAWSASSTTMAFCLR